MIAIGAHWDDDNGFDSGSTYIFRWNGTQWIEEQKLVASDGNNADMFGKSISVSSDVVVIGASTDDKGHNSGSAYIFRWNGVRWNEEQKLLASDGVEHDFFGHSVSILGDVAVIGAWQNYINGNGAAYIFRWDGAQWIEDHKLTAYDGAEMTISVYPSLYQARPLL